VQKIKDMKSGKLAINWQNIARVRLQLRFAFIIRPCLFLLVLVSPNSKKRPVRIYGKKEK